MAMEKLKVNGRQREEPSKKDSEQCVYPDVLYVQEAPQGSKIGSFCGCSSSVGSAFSCLLRRKKWMFDLE